jgi:hypothetical protein
MRKRDAIRLRPGEFVVVDDLDGFWLEEAVVVHVTGARAGATGRWAGAVVPLQSGPVGRLRGASARPGVIHWRLTGHAAGPGGAGRQPTYLVISR